MNVEKIAELLGKDGDYLLGFKTPKVKKDQLHIPGPDWIDRIMAPTDRPAEPCAEEYAIAVQYGKARRHGLSFGPAG